MKTKEAALSSARKTGAANVLAVSSAIIFLFAILMISASAADSGSVAPSAVDLYPSLDATAHTATIVLTPEWTYCGASNNFLVKVTNNGPAAVKEVRIYNGSHGGVTPNPPPHTDFACGAAPAGWKLYDLHPDFPICQYMALTPDYFLNSSMSQTFNFSATMTGESNYTWGVVTLDVNETWLPHYPNTVVDCTPPVTTKSFDGPQFPDNNDFWGTPHWINSSTEVVLSYYDPDPHPSGVNATYWRNTLVADKYCWNPALQVDGIAPQIACGSEASCSGPSFCNYAQGSGDFVKYTGPFHKEQESCHLIEYYSTDNVGNNETVKKQCVFVDNTPPVGHKQVGQPSILLNKSLTGFDYYVNMSTPITLDCFDEGNHPVNNNIVYWRFSNKSGDQWVPGDWNNASAPVMVYFPEDSYHDLEFYCADALGNEGAHDTEYFIVESQAPNITKEIIGPQYGNCPPENGGANCYITSETIIAVDAVDPDPHPSDDVECEWSYTLDGQPWDSSSGWITPPFNITFPEDSNHTLTITCKDALGNSITDVENFSVDLMPPVTNKTYGKPFVEWWYPKYCKPYDLLGAGQVCPANGNGIGCIPCGWAEWINSKTPVYLNATDNKVGVNKTYWRNMLVNNADAGEIICGTPKPFCHPEYYSQYVNLSAPWNEYKGQPFYKENESCHVIEYFSVDKLGNEENKKWQCVFVDNTAPELNKTIGDPKVVKKECVKDEDNGDMGAGALVAGPRTSNIFAGSLSAMSGEGPCVNATQPDQCSYVNVTDLPNYAKDTIKAQLNVSLDVIPEGCDKVLILSSGNPDNNGTSLTTGMGNPGCGLNPDNYTTLDCVILGNYTPPANVSILAVSSEWPEYKNSIYTDWMQVSDGASVDMSINNWKNVIELPQYGPGKSGTQTLASKISAGATVNLRVADSSDSAYDTTMLLVPLACGVPTGPAEKCGDGIVQQFLGEECDDGNNANGDGCSATCKLEDCENGTVVTKTYITQQTPITLTCKDVFPHPVDHVNISYRSKVSTNCEDLKNNNNWTGWTTVSNNGPGYVLNTTFTFPKDSCHELEYYCTDGLGNTGPIQTEIDVVDTQAPVINKTIVGPVHVDYNATCDEPDNGIGIQDVGIQSVGDLVGSVNFSVDCSVGVGIAYDGSNLWYTCASGTDLYRADPFTGNVTASYNIAGGLGAIAYDASRNAIWAGWADASGTVRLIQLNSSKEVVNSSITFMAPEAIYFTFDDGLAYDAEDDTLYISGDVAPTIHHYTTNGTHIGSFPHAGTISYGNSGLALGGSLLYEGFDGESFVRVVNKANTSAIVFNFSTAVAGDPNFRDEDLECDTNTFASIGKHVMWSVEAFSPRRAHAFEIPFGSCGIGGKPAQNCTKTYIDGVTNISVDATDPEPHPVDEVTCDWDYKVFGGDKEGEGQNGLTPPFIVHFPEESKHVLNITCKDKLNNTVKDVQTYYVDKTPPVTTKKYEGPQYPQDDDADDVTHWINNKTNITFSVYDAGKHKSGINATYTKVSLVDDQYCWNPELCQQYDNNNGLLKVFDKASPKLYFNIPEESCHLIEYYSVDNVNKTEETNRQCVFVDNTGPIPNKTIGKPAEKWDGSWPQAEAIFHPDLTERCWGNGSDRIDCWKVTTVTPITMNCTDPDPHPVDHSKLAFRVKLDSSIDLTEEYCEDVGGEMNPDGYCVINGEAPKTIYFKEESEHNLEFYCTDALGNKGPVDDEKFKVDGTAFDLKLYRKWNLISVPFVLLNSSVEDVFKDVKDNITAVWTYDNGQWLVWTPGPAPDTLEDIRPGWGYWVLTNDDLSIKLGGALFSPILTPPQKQLVEGWNLIGYYGVNWQEYNTSSESCSYFAGKTFRTDAYCALNSLTDTKEGHPRWSSLWTYVNPDCTGGSEPWRGINSCTDGTAKNKMQAGYGYWIEMDIPDLYAPSSVCFKQKNCVYFTPASSPVA